MILFILPFLFGQVLANLCWEHLVDTKDDTGFQEQARQAGW